MYSAQNEEKSVDHVRISKYKKIFAKNYFPTCSGEVFMIKKVKSKNYCAVDIRYL